MASPFPGMDPYIENSGLWSDFHSDLAGEIRSHINQQVQPRYFARLTPYVTYEVIEVGKPAYGIRPDVGIWHLNAPVGAHPSNAAVITPSVESQIPMEIPLTLHRVEIRETDQQTLVTVIEILSPVNKRPSHEAFGDYQRKRRDILRSAVHLIEIDLLREGIRPPKGEPEPPPAPYYVVLSRSERRPNIQVWPIQLADPLPLLPVPLLEPDQDAVLDLGARVRSVYERGAYHVQIDYRQPPPGPLSPAESDQVQELTATFARPN